MLALRHKQTEIREQYRTCKPEQLVRLQGQDSLLEFIFDESFADYVNEAFDNEKAKQELWKKNLT